ncbi:MAG: hypothetical protein J6K77_06500, partial [Ruminococcus sp.]|nr:hypothetical protein [Ruminococcus sp.]
MAESRGGASGRVWDRVPYRPQVDDAFRRSARGEFQNSPVDCFERGDALQERASPSYIGLYDKLKGLESALSLPYLNLAAASIKPKSSLSNS